MNVTFMIGNGFDLHLGLKTRYTDMYQAYIDEPSSTNVIAEFKNELKSHAENNFETWGDFEMAMANHISKYENENAFIECIRDFKNFLARYLDGEQEIYADYAQLMAGNELFMELEKSISKFYLDYTPNVVHAIEKIDRNTPDNKYNFVIFNYTEVLDELIKSGQRREAFSILKHIDKVIHVHGRLREDIVLGVDNSLQLDNPRFTVTPRLERAFIKPIYNMMVNQQRVQEAMQTILLSNVICIFGMSLGLSDLTWITTIKEWLEEDPDHHLFYFGRKTEKFQNKWNWDEILDDEDEKRNKILELLYDGREVDEFVIDQIHIPLHYTIFNFLRIISERERKSQENQRKMAMMPRLSVT